MNVENRQKIERRIARRIVRDAIEMGYSVSINNGGDDNEIDRSTDIKAVQAELMATDEENIIFHNKAGRSIGAVFMVYGNDGWDVMCDWTDTEEVNKILANAQRIADEEEKAWA